jgi:hypothetical protein
MNKTKPSTDQERHMITREQVEDIVRRLSDHPGSDPFRKMLATSDLQEFEIWLPKGYCNDCALCRPRS